MPKWNPQALKFTASSYTKLFDLSWFSDSQMAFQEKLLKKKTQNHNIF